MKNFGEIIFFHKRVMTEGTHFTSHRWNSVSLLYNHTLYKVYAWGEWVYARICGRISYGSRPWGKLFLVWITEKKRKSKVETLTLSKYLWQSQHVSNDHSVPGTWHVLSYLVLTIKMVILHSPQKTLGKREMTFCTTLGRNSKEGIVRLLSENYWGLSFGFL